MEDVVPRHTSSCWTCSGKHWLRVAVMVLLIRVTNVFPNGINTGHEFRLQELFVCHLGKLAS